jgi:hypothetical protein
LRRIGFEAADLANAKESHGHAFVSDPFVPQGEFDPPDEGAGRLPFDIVEFVELLSPHSILRLERRAEIGRTAVVDANE